jgi:putative ABC transport system permease protein
MWGASIDAGYRVDGRAPDPERPLVGHVRLVTAGYVETLGIPLIKGRLLQESDLQGGAPWVVVVNETFARNVFRDANPLGQRISGWASSDKPEWREIVGVVGDVRAFGRENDVPPEVYIPMTQAPANAWNPFQRAVTVIAKSSGGTPIAPAVRQAVNAVDPSLPLYDVQSMENVLAQSTAERRFSTSLLILLGLTGLTLAAIGLYGVMAFFVSQRTQDIGVRVALGADSWHVVRLVVQQAMTLTAVGIVTGGIAAWWATGVLGRMLYDTSARDPMVFASGAIVLMLVTFAAAWLPARKAARVDPATAIRED